MAHFAQLDDNNTVIQVIVVHNNELLDESGQESEQRGRAFCESILGGRWVQTSYNGNFRKNFASIGGTYDPVRDAFIPPKPLPSWILDEAKLYWTPPVPMPNDGKQYFWNEADQIWVEETV